MKYRIVIALSTVKALVFENQVTKFSIVTLPLLVIGIWLSGSLRHAVLALDLNMIFDFA